MKKSFNLSDWALEHRSLVWYFMPGVAVGELDSEALERIPDRGLAGLDATAGGRVVDLRELDVRAFGD